MEEISLKNCAYIGDAVWELKIRNITIFRTDNPRNLHKLTTEKVKASYQAECLHKIEEYLTAQEKELSRRARNLSIPVARRANQVEYRQATAFEALIGWWYLHDKNRLDEICSIIL